MASREYQTVLQSFDWKEARAALGWNEDRTVSLGDALVDRHANSGRTALISASIDGTETQMTFAELANASNQFANLLTRMGIGPGDRVAGLMPRGPEVFITILGTLKAGAIYVPIFTGFGPDAVGYRLEQSQAKLLITDLEYYDRIPGDASVKGSWSLPPIANRQALSTSRPRWKRRSQSLRRFCAKEMTPQQSFTPQVRPDNPREERLLSISWPRSIHISYMV